LAETRPPPAGGWVGGSRSYQGSIADVHAGLGSQLPQAGLALADDWMFVCSWPPCWPHRRPGAVALGSKPRVEPRHRSARLHCLRTFSAESESPHRTKRGVLEQLATSYRVAEPHPRACIQADCRLIPFWMRSCKKRQWSYAGHGPDLTAFPCGSFVWTFPFRQAQGYRPAEDA